MNDLSDKGKKARDIPKYSRRCIIAQWIVAVIIALIIFNLGLIVSIPTIVIGGLLEEKEMFHISSIEASWFASIPFVSISIGSLLSGFLQDCVGRQRATTMAHIPCILSWILLYYSNSTTVLYSSAAVMGLSFGLIQCPLLSYSGEVFIPELRGTLVSVQGIVFNIGCIGSFFLGAIYPWKTVVGVCTVWPIFTVFLSLLIPESPLWLAQKRKTKKGKASLCWLRGWVKEEYVEDEWCTVVQQVNMINCYPVVQQMLNENEPLSDNESNLKQEIFKETKSNSYKNLKIFFSSALLRPLLLIIIYVLGAFCISLVPMKPLLISILTEMKISVDPYWFMVISSIISVIGAIAFSLVLKAFGKRLLTFFGFIISISTCYGLGLYIMLDLHIPWIPLVLFSITSFISTFGITSIPWILISEIFPLEFRGVASGVTSALANLTTFFTTKTYINAKLSIGLSWSFIMYGSIGLLALIYLYLKLPETEGRTIHDIETDFKQKRKKNPSV